MYKESIPVFGTAVVNETHWVSKQLSTIDYPIDNYVIINNNGRGIIDEELDRLSKTSHRFINKITVVHMPANIGCSGAWNLIIKSYINAPYWIIANDDVSFQPGLLKELHDTACNNEDTGMIHPSNGYLYPNGDFNLFLIRDFVIQKYGLFDENTYPAYCEDVDYYLRFYHNPLKRKIGGFEHGYFHGEDEATISYSSGSKTKKVNDKFTSIIDTAANKNYYYLFEKWGNWNVTDSNNNWISLNPDKVPFGNNKPKVSDLTYDLNFVRSKYTGF